MTKPVRTTLMLALIGSLMTTTGYRAHASGVGPCSTTRYELTRSTPAALRELRAHHLIRCVFTYVGIPGQVATALKVARRESGYIPWAKNPWTDGACRAFSPDPYGSCGLFQHLARYWPARVRAYLPAKFFPQWPHVSVLGARANTWATARMVKAGGWGPWS